jgi:hypothetical protein
MDNFRKELHSDARADAKTALAVFCTDFHHQNLLNRTGIFLGPVTKAIWSSSK